MDQISNFFSTSEISGWDVVLAILAVVAGFVGGSLLKRTITAVGRRWPQISPTVINLLARIAKYFVVLLGIGVALVFFGANMQPLLAGIVIVGVVLALALRGIADNFGAAIVLQSRHPIKLGDDVEVQGHRGIVQDMNARSVVIHTLDGRRVHIPNSSVLQNPLTNHSEEGERRSSIAVRMLTTRPFDEMIAIVHGALASIDGVHPRPIQVLATMIASDRMHLTVRFWHAAPGGAVVSSDVITGVAAALADARIDSAVVTSSATADLIVPQPLV